MKTADYGADIRSTGQFPGIKNGIDDAGMGTPGDDHQSLVF